MNLLLDTQILVWLIETPTRLTRGEHRIINRAKHSTIVSAMTLWEMRVKWDLRDRRGRRKGVIDPAFARDYAMRSGMSIAPLTPEIAIASLRHPVETNDPFDEMLLIHAQELGARILTRDGKMLEHPLAIQP